MRRFPSGYGYKSTDRADTGDFAGLRLRCFVLENKNYITLLQLLGAACLMIVVLAHFCEALGLLPWMGWGLPNSVGHYLDLGSAAFGLTLFPIGYLWHELTRRS